MPLKSVALLGQLTKQLSELKSELDEGQTPDADLLKKLKTTVDAIAAMIATPATTQAAPSPIADLDPLKTIEAASTASPIATLPSQTPAAADPDASTAATDPTTILASLGVAAPSQPLPAIAALAQQLSDAAASTALPPDVAKSIDALVQKLTVSETDPTTLAQLTSAADTGGTALDKLVQQMLAAKAPALPSPKLASTTQLDNPVVSVPPTAASDDAAAPAITSPATSSSMPALKLTAVPATDTPVADKQSKTDPSSIGAAGPADRTAAAAVDPSTQTTAAVTAAAALATAAVTSAAKPLPAAYQTVQNPINMGQMAFELAHQMQQGQSRFSIRLDPPELGRVDVKMHVDASGTVNARLSVERAETLDMFQRDQGALQKALSQAGLDSSKTNLEFSLKQNPFAGMTGGDQRPSGGFGNAGGRFGTDGDDGSAIPAITLYRGSASAGGVNLFV